MKGALGTFVGEAIYFKNDNGMFEVQFDAGRAARKKIEGCQLDWFVWSKSKCLFDVDAEISISEAFSLAEGGKITLIIYDIRE